MLPPLYQGLEPVMAQRHAGLRLGDAGFGFAAAANGVPLAAEEFIIAARTMPIVFAAQAPHAPLALTGLQPGHNFYIEDGKWRAGTYVPAYLRRYPFFLVRVSEGSQELALCLDPNAPQFAAGTGEALFDAEGKPSDQLKRAFEFCRAVEEAMLRTRAMSEGLAALGLLKPSQVQFDHGGKPLRMDGFHAVDREALKALPPEALAELRDKGWLEPIYAHLLSIGGLPELARDLNR
jgi:hypothetical protein